MTGLFRISLALCFTFCLLPFVAQSSYAQASAQYLHSAGIVLDDGAGHTTTLLPTAAYATFAPAYVYAFLPGIFAPYVAPVGFYIPTYFAPLKAGFTINANGAAVASAAGIYTVDFSVTPGSASTFALYQNAGYVGLSQVDCAANTTTHSSVILSLAAGDVIKIINTGTTGATLGPLNAGTNLATLTIVRIQ